MVVYRETKNAKYMMEFQERSGTHRLVNMHTGHRTAWTSYIGFTYLDGMVGATAYYGAPAAIYTPDEFCKLVGVGSL